MGTVTIAPRSRTRELSVAVGKPILRDEFTFRLNEDNVTRHTTQRLASFVDATAGKRLTYKDLIG